MQEKPLRISLHNLTNQSCFKLKLIQQLDPDPCIYHNTFQRRINIPEVWVGDAAAVNIFPAGLPAVGQIFRIDKQIKMLPHFLQQQTKSNIIPAGRSIAQNLPSGIKAFGTKPETVFDLINRIKADPVFRCQWLPTGLAVKMLPRIGISIAEIKAQFVNCKLNVCFRPLRGNISRRIDKSIVL